MMFHCACGIDERECDFPKCKTGDRLPKVERPAGKHDPECEVGYATAPLCRCAERCAARQLAAVDALLRREQDYLETVICHANEHAKDEGYPDPLSRLAKTYRSLPDAANRKSWVAALTMAAATCRESKDPKDHFVASQLDIISRYFEG